MVFTVPSSPALPSYTTPELYSLLAPITTLKGPGALFTNWASTYSSQTTATFRPSTIEQVRLVVELARRERKELRASGSGHSPSDLVCTDGFVINMDGLDKLLEVDTTSGIAHIEGGIKLRNLHPLLAKYGLSISSLGSISDQALAGAISTATHGSGVSFGNLSTMVTFLDLVLPTEGIPVVRVSREQDEDMFMSALCGLGCIGLIVGVGFQCEQSFKLEEECWSMSFGEFVEHWEEISQSAEHVRCWWFPQVGEVKVSRLNRTQNAITPSPSSLSTYVFDNLISKHYHALILFISRTFPSILPWHAQVMYALVHRPASIASSALGLGKKFDWPTVGGLQNRIVRITSRDERKKLGGGGSEDGERTRVPSPTSTPDYDGNDKGEDEIVHLKRRISESLASSIPPVTEIRRTKEGVRTKSLGQDFGEIEILTDPTLKVDESVKIFNYDCGFPQYTYESAVPYALTTSCLLALEAWQTKELNDPKGLRNHFPVEFRWVKGDDIWLSNTQGGGRTYIGIIQYRPYNLPVPYKSLFRTFEQLLLSHEGRPHWAKSHNCSPSQLHKMYPFLEDFLRVRERSDPAGVLLGPYIRRHLLGEVGEELDMGRFKASKRG